MNTQANSAHFTLNGQPLADLKRAAKADGAGSLKAVAKQFESMLLNTMMKSMRAGTGDGVLGNESTKLFTEMLDQEYSQKIANGKGIGLADALVAQLSRPQIRSVDAETQPKAFPLHPISKDGGYNKGLPGAAQTPIPLPGAQQPKNIPLPGRAYPLQSLGLDTGGTLLASA